MNIIQKASNGTDSRAVAPRDSNKYAIYQQLAIALLCLALTIAAYLCVVQKSFLGDDHVHLIWLRQAVVHPELVLRNFYSNWLYAGTTPQCYRPIVSVFMYTDYLIWHHNAIGFHITNLLFHGIACLALYGCVLEVLRWNQGRTTPFSAPLSTTAPLSATYSALRLWPVLAAGTFALYPSHPEAVSWVTGRVDTIVTAFYLLCTYTYMLWRRTGKSRFFVLALLNMLLALASKEMAVTIPAVLLMFELLRPPVRNVGSVGSVVASSAVGSVGTVGSAGVVGAVGSDGSAGSAGSAGSVNSPGSVESIAAPDGEHCSFIRRVRKALKYTAPLWLLLAGYFLLRRLALGTFVGGYDDTLGVDWHLLADHWHSGLSKFFLPINSYYSAGNDALLAVWGGLTTVMYLITACFLVRPQHRNQILFFLAFSAISFLPVYKLFVGMPDLQASRFSYLASAPISALFAFGLAALPMLFTVKQPGHHLKAQLKVFSSVSQVFVCVVYFCVAAYMLWLNNQPWMVAGRWVSRMEKDFNALMDGATKQDHFVFFNISNQYRGAYLTRNAIRDIGGHQDVDWKDIEPDDRFCETGQIRKAIETNPQSYKCYFWNEQLGCFSPVAAPSEKLGARIAAWNSGDIANRLKVIQGASRVQDSGAGKMTVSAGPEPVMLLLNFSTLPPWAVSFLKLDIEKQSSASPVDNSGVNLIISDSLLPTTVVTSNDLGRSEASDGWRGSGESSESSKSSGAGESSGSRESSGASLLFGLRLIPGWFCAKDSATAVITLPPNWSGKFAVSIPDEAKVLPALRRLSPDKFVTNQSPLVVKVDVSKIPGAVDACLQISRKNEYFLRQNSTDFEQTLTGKNLTIGSTTAEKTLTNGSFSGSGQYQIRCWAIDRQGHRIGICSDYLLAIVL